MLLLIDNFDSFSHMLADYLRQAGAELKVVRNDVSLEEIAIGEYDGIVLSPGPETPEKAGNLMEILDHYHDKLPVLGICLGHQAIGEYFGAQLVKGTKPVHGKVHAVQQVGHHPVLADIPARFNVTRYHSLVLKSLPECLETILETEQNEIMALAHRALPIVGIQFHPEAHLTENGLALLQRWVKVYVSEKEEVTC